MNRKIIWYTLSVVMFISAAVLIAYFFWANGYFEPPKTVETEAYDGFTYPSLPDEISVDIIPSENGTADYVSPVDFDDLKTINTDIVGWLYMSSPYISQPILRSTSDDAFYLSHGPTGDYDKSGSFYIEGQYNGIDFNAPCTIIYGHRMSDGSVFGNLQSTFDSLDINANPQYIAIYLPNETKIYHIIATIPYDESHILYYNDFSDEAGYNNFFDNVYSTTGSEVQLVNEGRPVYGDRILILSTCLRTDRTQRYLVIATEVS